jgi:Zn-dependent protease
MDAAVNLNVWLSILVATIVHEAGHYMMAQLRGVRVKRLGISWIGPYLVRERGSSTDNIWIAFAGPAANLLFFVWSLLLGESISAASQLFLGVTNLVPVPGLDGHRILQEFILRRRLGAESSAMS